MVFVHFGLLRLFVIAAAIETTRQRERSWFSARRVAILERFWAVARLSKMVFVHFGLLRLFVIAVANRNNT